MSSKQERNNPPTRAGWVFSAIWQTNAQGEPGTYAVFKNEVRPVIGGKPSTPILGEPLDTVQAVYPNTQFIAAADLPKLGDVAHDAFRGNLPLREIQKAIWIHEGPIPASPKKDIRLETIQGGRQPQPIAA